MPIDEENFRAVFAALPTTVAVVTTTDANGEPKGLTSNTVCPVSLDPPQLLLCVDRRARTLPALLESGAFVVNFLAGHAEDVSRRFAGKAPEKFTGLHWVPSATADGAPILPHDTTAYAECVVERAFESGDHYVFLARIESASVPGGAPLIYFRRDYSTWAPLPGQTVPAG